MSKIWRVEEEQIMKAGKIVGINYTVWYKDENGTRTARREYRHGHYKVIPMTVLNFILDESNEANTKYQEFDGCIYKRTMYQEEKKMENINMTTAQEDIEDAIKFGWIEGQEATNTNDTKSEEEQTMNTNTKKYSFEIRQIDALNYGEDEGWIWNTSYNMGEMVTKAKDEKKAFTAWMKRHLGISFKSNRTLIEYDGDVYTIIDRKTKEPLFAAIPNC